MVSSSDIGTQLSTQFLLKMLRGQLNETQRQIGSGKKSATLAGMGTLGASNSIAYRNRITALKGYTDNLNAGKAKFSVMDKALGLITGDARDVMTHLRSQLQSTTPQAAIISNQASGMLSNVLSQLNTQVNGQYQFAGDNLYTPPFSSQATLDTNVGGLVSGFLAGSPTVSSVVAAARGVTGANLGFSAGVLTSGSVQFRADDGTDIDYTVKATQAGFADVMRGMTLIKNLPQPTTQAEQNNYWVVVNAAIQLIDEGSKAIDQYQGVLGTKAKLVDDLIARHNETTGTFEDFIGSVEDVDVAEATTKLQSLQTQLQMSYSIIGQMQGLSLVNYLR